MLFFKKDKTQKTPHTLFHKINTSLKEATEKSHDIHYVQVERASEKFVPSFNKPFDFEQNYPDKMGMLQQKSQYHTFKLFLFLGMFGLSYAVFTHHWFAFLWAITLTLFLGWGNALTRGFRQEKPFNKAHAMFRGALDGITQYCSGRRRKTPTKPQTLDFNANPRFYYLSQKVSTWTPWVITGLFSVSLLMSHLHIFFIPRYIGLVSIHGVSHLFNMLFYGLPVAWLAYKMNAKYDENNLHPDAKSAWADGIGRGIGKFYYHFTKGVGFTVVGAFVLGGILHTVHQLI